MNMFYLDSTGDFIAQVKDIERRADQCIEHFALSNVPTHVACWTVLSTTVQLVEDNLGRFGPESSKFHAAMLNLSRHAPLLIRWLGRSGMSAVSLGWTPQWDSVSETQALRDLRVVSDYDAFLSSFPMWYRNRLSAELLNNDVVRFQTSQDGRDRQVSAFQKGLRRRTGIHKAIAGGQVEPTEAVLRRYGRMLDSAQAVGQRGFRYEHSYELTNGTFRKYTKRMDQIMRRSEDLDLGVYTLGKFKRFYVALQSICAIHDFLCFLWKQRTGRYPIESAVLVKKRDDWIKLLSLHSGTEHAETEQLLSDLTFYSKRLADLHVFPFIPLDEDHKLLALIPQFILNSSPEENIIRTCSYLRERSFSLLSDNKSTLMRQDLLETFKRFRCGHSISLPDGSTDIDLLIEDLRSSTVIIAELKWYRKPSTYRERLRVDTEFEDGFNRQLATVKAYCRQNPTWLKHRKSLTRSLSDYDNVFYLLVGRDHWSWFNPQDSTAVVEYEQLRLAVGREDRLDQAIQDLLRYDWLPVEGVDFHVLFERRFVEGVGVESAVYYGGPPK
jgi:hypothetical protein